MKQKLLHQSLIATLVTMVLLLAGSSVSAQEEYGLEIAGVKVTSANCSDLSVIDGVKGKVSYDPTTKTLTLEDASINDEEVQRHSIWSTDELTCVVKGKVSITSNGWGPMGFEKNAIIKGNGQLTLKSLLEGGCGIYTQAALLIEGCTVYAEGYWGIIGRNGSSSSSLTIRNTTVTAKGSTYGSILELTNFTLEGCEITKPAGAVWNDSKHAVCDASGNVITDEVVITPVEYYNLEIAGVRVNSENCYDLTAIPGVTGKVTYDPTTKTLTLEDASIDGGEGQGIGSKVELTCVVKGKVSITSNKHAVVFYNNAIIKGNGQLTLKAPKGCGIYTLDALLIEGRTVYAEGKWGIAGRDGSSGESLTIRNASVTAKGTKGSIRDFANFTLEGCEITKPAGAVWNASKRAVCDASGNVITDEVVITPPVETYGLWIAGVEVSSANCSDLTAIPGVTGKVSYDPTTKTLTLEDATIDGGQRQGIGSTVELTCVVKGEVSITSNKRAMMFYNNAIIKGNGQLTLKSPEGCGIYMDVLLIEGCTVYAEGKWGIKGSDGTIGESLTIRNASVTAKGTTGSICDLADFTLEGCSITKPAGAVWNDSKHAVCDASGNVITSEVVITPPVKEYGLAIAGVRVSSANCSDLTAIPGVKGKASYAPTTKTLTLEDATIDGGVHDGLETYDYDELTCVVKGEVSITSNNRSAMMFYSNAIIKGNGQLTLKSSEKCGICTVAALLIEGCTVYAEGEWGISGSTGSSGESLTIRNATVTAKGSTYGSIRNFTNFTLEGCSITKPAGAVWNASKHAVCTASGNVITDEVVITPVEEYGLKIAGVMVNSVNCSDLSAIPGVTGKVTYDPTTKTLTLEDASIDGRGIWSIDELTCVVKGEVSITSNLSAMAFAKNAIIKGNGQLTLKSSEQCGIYTLAALLIEGCTVYAEGYCGIAGQNAAFGESLTIRNASVTAKGTKGSICGLANFTLEGCEITKPAGAVWNDSKHAVCDASGNVIKDEVVITPPVPVEEYGLEIAGVQVTSENCSDLTAIPGVKGKVSYDPTTKTLTIEDASIDAGEDRRGICSTDELTCVVKGKVSITSNNWHAMVFFKNAIIKGNGQLTLKSLDQCGIYTKATLLIEGCTVYAEGKWGITGKDGTSGESLTIRNASVTAKGTHASIRDLANFTLDGCSITKPAGAVWNASKHAVCDASGNVITDEVVITPTGGVTPPVEEYGLKIAGVEVTSANCSDLSVIPGVTGKVSYDPTTKTLTLEDASIDGREERQEGIWSRDELTCVVKGEVSITSNNENAMEFYKNAIIKGNGQLTLKSREEGGIYGGCGIYTEAALLIEGCTVYAEGKWGISGHDGTFGESLTIRNATVTAKGTEGSILDLANFTLDGCSITKPAGAVWNDSKYAVCDASGNVITSEVVIAPPVPVEEYGLKIAGVKVTSANCSDLTAIPGVKGKVSSDPTTKTLTLEDATIDGGEQRGIWSKDQLTCVVKGKVSITSKNTSAMGSYSNAIIKGNGQLTLKSREGSGIYTEAALLIEGCTVYAEGVFGIAGNDGSSGESLTIRNATVTVKGSTYGSICDLANFTLEGCEITKPAGAVWNASKHAVCDASGNVITDEVVITPPVEKYTVTFVAEPAGQGTLTATGAADLSAVPYETELTIEATPAAGYELKALTANGADILATKKVVVIEATEVKATFAKKTAADRVEAGSVRLYPNPASTYVNVKATKADALVRLYDANGTLLYEARTDDHGLLQIELSAYEEGTYLLLVDGNAQRLLIQR